MLYTIKHFFRTNDTILNKITYYIILSDYSCYIQNDWLLMQYQQNINRQYNVQSV